MYGKIYTNETSDESIHSVFSTKVTVRLTTYLYSISKYKRYLRANLDEQNKCSFICYYIID